MVDGLENTVQKGRAFELLTKCFLQLDPKYATTLKNVWSHNAHEVPDSIRNKLNLPKPDEGIDIIAETYEGEFWSIQCKYIADESESIGRKKLATFTDLSFTICKNISLALICTPLDRFSYKLDKYYGDRISYCAGENYRDLGNEFFFRAQELFAGNKVPIKAYEPRDHQIRAIINAIEHFEDNEESRGKMIMPCGAGKSLTAYWIAQELLPNKVLIAVPSLSLVRQTLEVWARECLANNENFRWICVCSDETVKDAGNDDQSVLAQDLGIKVNGDPKEIAKWLTKETTSTNIVFSTYQSGKTLTEAARLAGVTFDLGIFDEAHKTVGVRDKLFAHMLFDKNIKIRKRLFMTATERQYRGDSDEILSMDNTDVYGETFEVLSFKEALACNPPILSDYKVVTLAVTTDEIKELINANVFVRPEAGKVDEEVEAKMLAAALQVRKTMSIYPVRHCLSFHSSIARAESFQKTHQNINEKFGKYGNLDCFHIRGSMPTSLRKKKLDQSIESPKSLVTNARCLTEGIDVKEIDGVLFADPKGSTIDIVQAVGRALRPHSQKEFGYIMIPVLLDSNKLRERIAQNEAYEDLLMTMRALASNDDRIIDYLKALAEDREPPSGSVECEFKASKESDFKLEDFARDVSLKIWSKLAKLSWMPFEEAREFVRKLRLKGQVEWREYIRNGKTGYPPLPEDIPKSPEATYKRKGWLSWGDWLGHENIKGNPNFQKKDWRPFEQAREFAQSLDLKNQKEWVQYRVGKMPELKSLPSDIPKVPESAYRGEGWDGYGDWLGTGNTKGFGGGREKIDWRPFEQAREFVQSLGLKSQIEWREYSKSLNKPDDIPTAPDRYYKNRGWDGYGDWLGTGKTRASGGRTKKVDWRPFEQAREFVQSLSLKNQNEWWAYTKSPSRPEDIPATPHLYYKNNGWSGYGDWLGTGNTSGFRRKRSTEEWLDFEEARNFTLSLGLKSQQEWRQYTAGKINIQPSFPYNIPVAPQVTYKKKWVSWGDWLGTGNTRGGGGKINKEWLPFEDARKFTQSLGLKSQQEWKQYTSGRIEGKPSLLDGIPRSPDYGYKNDGWVSWGDWLGTGNKRSKRKVKIEPQWRSFKEARGFTRSLGLKSQREWTEYASGKAGMWFGDNWISFSSLPKCPNDIPKAPDNTYKYTGWIGWVDWLGKVESKKASSKKWRPFEEARNFVRALKIKSTRDWKKFTQGKLEGLPTFPNDIPTVPENSYKNDGWTGYGDWLGTFENRNKQRAIAEEWRSFEAARRFVHELKLSSWQDWLLYTSGKKQGLPPLPADIPKAPYEAYKKEGWSGRRDWLSGSNIKDSFKNETSKEWRQFEEAREFARSLGLKKQQEWADHCKNKQLPNDIPSNPSAVYKSEGWKSWYDWLRQRKWMPFEEARDFAHSLNLKSSSEWIKYYKGEISELAKLPKNIPTNPQLTYKSEGWKSWSDWLGIGTLKVTVEPQWLPFKKAREFVRSLGLSSLDEWNNYCSSGRKDLPKLPDNIPPKPYPIYRKKGWKSWSDWLGHYSSSKRKQPNKWRQFELARNFVHLLECKSFNEWKDYCSNGKDGYPTLPKDIPVNPQNAYKKEGWESWGDWLGTTKSNEHLKENWMPFEKAREFARSLKLSGASDWVVYCAGLLLLPEKPNTIPAGPNIAYKGNGWIDWEDWLGFKWMSYDKAKDFTAKLKLKDAKEWKSYVLGDIPSLPIKPPKIPANPEVEYVGKGWRGYKHWLGLEDSKEVPNKWTEIVNYLDKYNQTYGHFKVPETEQFKQLKTWIQTVCSRKSEGTLDSELQEMLEQINFDWGE